MQLGAIFPQTEIGADPAGVKDFAQAAEALGYEHLLVFDHVLGADASPAGGMEPSVQQRGSVPRALCAVRLSGRRHGKD